jgi:hypothetical protein
LALRVDVSHELKEIHATIDGSWCLTGDFNSIIGAHEKSRGALINQSQCNAFIACNNDCIVSWILVSPVISLIGSEVHYIES